MSLGGEGGGELLLGAVAPGGGVMGRSEAFTSEVERAAASTNRVSGPGWRRAPYDTGSRPATSLSAVSGNVALLCR